VKNDNNAVGEEIKDRIAPGEAHGRELNTAMFLGK
jgi:hypothetical protein